jgi:hypothetical protein
MSNFKNGGKDREDEALYTDVITNKESSEKELVEEIKNGGRNVVICTSDERDRIMKKIGKGARVHFVAVDEPFWE